MIFTSQRKVENEETGLNMGGVYNVVGYFSFREGEGYRREFKIDEGERISTKAKRDRKKHGG